MPGASTKLPAADGPSDGTEDPEHRADDDQHHADVGHDRDTEYQPKDEQDCSQDNHGYSISSELLTAS